MVKPRNHRPSLPRATDPRAPDPGDPGAERPHRADPPALSVIGELSLEILHQMANLWTNVHGIAHSLRSVSDAQHTAGDLVRELAGLAEVGRALSHQLHAVAHQRPETARTLALDQLTQDTVALIRTLLPSRLDVTFHRAPGDYRVWGVAAQLRLVLLTLATNARDAISGSGTLAISLAPTPSEEPPRTSARPPSCVLRVRDDGCGLSEESLARAFEPGYSRKEGPPGSGYGLTHARRIAADHRGSLHLQSEPGLGTCAELTLPRWEPDASDAPSPAPGRPDSAPAPRADRAVLLVDDDDATREVLQDMVSSLGFGVRAAGGGEEALHMLREHPGDPRLVITDLRMPGMNGLELACHIRELEAPLPVILISGDAEDPGLDPDQRRAIHCWLQKPVGLAALGDALRAVLAPTDEPPSGGAPGR